MRNKTHDCKLILQEINEYENTGLSNTEIIQKYECDRNAFFYYLRKRRNGEILDNENFTEDVSKTRETQSNKKYFNAMEQESITTSTNNIIDTPIGRFKQITLSGKAKKDLHKYVSEKMSTSDRAKKKLDSEALSTVEVKNNKPRKRLDLKGFSNHIISYEKI